jgi:hypothetical protein
MAIKKPLVLGTNGLPQQLQSGDTIAVPTSQTNTMAMSNAEASALVIGTPVYNQAAGAVKKAQANATGTARVMGLVADASIAAAASGAIATDGVLTATTTQWDAVTGETGGLTFGAIYFLDPANAGKLTRTVPSTAGQLVVKVGIALSSVDFLVEIEPEILL